MKIKLYILIIWLILIPNVLLFYFDTELLVKLITILSSLIIFLLAKRIIRQIYRPFELVKSGIETIKDGDYTVFLNTQGSKHEFTQLIDLYNLMIQQLQNKRLEIKKIQQFFEEIIQKLPFSVIIIDELNHLKFANRHAENNFHFTFSKYKDRKIGILENDEINLILNKQNNDQWMQIKGRSLKIKMSSFQINGIVHHVYSIEELTRQLKNYQLETWKRIVRVISHEIQNSISPIISINQSIHDFLKSKEDVDDDYKEGIDYINKRLNRLSNFVSEYSKIAKLPELARKNVKIDHFFYQLIGLFKGNKVKIIYSNKSSVNYFFIDEKLFEQAMINIIKNAIEACHDIAEPLIEISIEKTEHRPKLIVKDNGNGISEEAMENIFVPYYTTKEKGTGIGLTLVQEILNKHEFNYYIESKINLHTSFYIEIK
jgi:two-component system, NtrC family, nitrogen regulation sensor histidine kinase NtrY